MLHPGVPVLWHTHIRDLSPAEAVRGAVCQGNELPWFAVANQEIKGRYHMSPLWCLSVRTTAFEAKATKVTFFGNDTFLSHYFGFSRSKKRLFLILFLCGYTFEVREFTLSPMRLLFACRDCEHGDQHSTTSCTLGRQLIRNIQQQGLLAPEEHDPQELYRQGGRVEELAGGSCGLRGQTH